MRWKDAGRLGGGRISGREEMYSPPKKKWNLPGRVESVIWAAEGDADTPGRE